MQTLGWCSPDTGASPVTGQQDQEVAAFPRQTRVHHLSLGSKIRRSQPSQDTTRSGAWLSHLPVWLQHKLQDQSQCHEAGAGLPPLTAFRA